MGVLDRVRQNQANRQKGLQGDTSHPGSMAQSSLVLAEPPHIKRLKGVVKMLRTMIEANNDGSGLARFAFIMTSLTDELAEDLAEYDELTIRAFMFQIGEVISWIGHGDNERLPEAVQVFADNIQATVTNNAGTSPEPSTTTR